LPKRGHRRERDRGDRPPTSLHPAAATIAVYFWSGLSRDPNAIPSVPAPAGSFLLTTATKARKMFFSIAGDFLSRDFWSQGYADRT